MTTSVLQLSLPSLTVVIFLFLCLLVHSPNLPQLLTLVQVTPSHLHKPWGGEVGSGLETVIRPALLNPVLAVVDVDKVPFDGRIFLCRGTSHGGRFPPVEGVPLNADAFS